MVFNISVDFFLLINHFMKYFEKAMATIQIKQQVVKNIGDATLVEL
jgi:hypothetical protein